MTFDPFATPAPGDIPARAARIGTAASVIATLLASAPGQGIIENLTNPDLLKMWPLRDATSLEGIDVLLASSDTSGDYRADYLHLFGFAHTVAASVYEATGNAEAATRMREAFVEARYTPAHLSAVAYDHISNILGFTAFVATAGGSALRSDDADALRTSTARLSWVWSGENRTLATSVAQGLESSAKSSTYRAAGLLLRGLNAELDSFLAELSGGR